VQIPQRFFDQAVSKVVGSPHLAISSGAPGKAFRKAAASIDTTGSLSLPANGPGVFGVEGGYCDHPFESKPDEEVFR